MMTGRQKGYKKNRSEEEAPMRIPASPMRRGFAAAPPLVKYKKAPQAPKRFKSSYVLNCSVRFELVRTVRCRNNYIPLSMSAFSFLFCFFVLTVRLLSVIMSLSVAPFCSFVLTVRFCFVSIRWAAIFSFPHTNIKRSGRNSNNKPVITNNGRCVPVVPFETRKND